MEFAFIAPFFVLLMIGIIETGLMLYASSALDGAARQAARLVRTGQAQAAEAATTGNGIADFEKSLCANLPSFMSCSDVAFDVESFGSFSAIDLTTLPPLQTNGTVTRGFSPGDKTQPVIVRVSYSYDLFNHVAVLANAVTSGRLSNALTLTSVVVFQNEPF
jgi:Flp pilus assembly protein TadG